MATPDYAANGYAVGASLKPQLFQLIAILATAKLPEDRLSRAVFVLIRVAQTQSCWQMARSMRASVPFEGDHYGRTWANQLRNAPFRRISWSRWFETRPPRHSIQCRHLSGSIARQLPNSVIGTKIAPGHPTSSYRRKACPVLRYGAGIQSQRPGSQSTFQHWAGPIFIPLCGLHEAIVIPNVAQRSEESKDAASKTT